jgi:AcrR family transcriptional regulator
MPDAHAESTASPRLDLIADATRSLFARYGYRRTSMDDIAREAGMAKATLYAHCASKDDVFRAMIARCHALVMQRCDEAERLPAPLQERLVALLDANFGSWLEWFANTEHWAELRTIAGEVSREPTYGQGYRARLRRLLLEAEQRGEIGLGRINADEAATVLLHAALGAKHERLRSRDEYRNELQRIARVAMAGLTP